MMAASRSLAGFQGGMLIYSWDAPQQSTLYVTDPDGTVRHEIELNLFEAEMIRRAINHVIAAHT